MKTFKYLLFVVVLLVGASCNENEDLEQSVYSNESFKTYVILLEDVPESYIIGLDYTNSFCSTFRDSEFSFDFKRIIIAKIGGKDIEKFLEIATKTRYIVSVTLQHEF